MMGRIAVLVAAAIGLTACGEGDMDVSTSRGDPAPDQVTLVYENIYTNADTGEELFRDNTTDIFIDISKFDYRAGGDLSIAGVVVSHTTSDKLRPIAQIVGQRVALDIEADKVISVEISSDAQAIPATHTPRHDGLYTAEAEGVIFHLYFNEAGRVRMAVTSGGQAANVAKWIATKENVYNAAYKVSGRTVRFLMPLESETSLDYVGDLSDDTSSLTMTVQEDFPRALKFTKVDVKQE